MDIPRIDGASGTRVADREVPLVLVVDGDDPAAAVALRAAGYRVTQLHSADDLLRAVRAEVPAAVVMDLVLPDMSGLDAAAALRLDRRTAAVPVIAGTASWLADRPDLLRPAGFAGAVRKPFQPRQVVGEVERVLASPGTAASLPADPVDTIEAA